MLVRLAVLNWILIFLLATQIGTGSLHAQTDSLAKHTSTLRGTIRAAKSELPVIGARVKVLGTKLGAITDAEGSYRIERVPIGHYTVSVTSSDYAPQTGEIIVRSAHQAVLDFSLAERRIDRNDSLTVYGAMALTPVDPYAVSSVTPFNVEDVNRYAAAFKDPSRMAENFAGVFGRGTSNNYIVVRGGSPIELLWRLDEIDIPDPNHFGKSGSSGGLISAINSSALGNGDFFSGAFPAEYGTKLSAVFDLRTRNGNTERVESRLELSFNGLEASTEGPIPLIDNASFLATYRHSTLGVLRKLGLLDYNNLPDFDDAMLKLHLPVGQNDQLNLTGLWGTANLNTDNSTGDELGAGSGILVTGLDWQHIYSDQWLGHVYINFAGNRYDERTQRGLEEITTGYSTAKTTLTYNPNARHAIELGATVLHGNFALSNFAGTGFDTSIHYNNYTAFVNWNWHLVPELVLNTGLFAQWIPFDSGSSYEPRASLAWSPTEEHTFSIAYGIHRQPEPFKLAQATHYVAGYTYRAADDLLFKAETYLKQYSDAPIHATTRDFFSFLNEGFANRINFSDLTNQGKGRTYGAELTMLKHFASGYFVTATGSLVRQEFAGSDGIWHFGAFDNIYIANLVTGFDIALSASSTLTLGEKFTIAGGSMYTPFDISRSIAEGREVLDSAHAYSARNDPYVRLDVNLEFKFNWQHSAMTVYASVLNVLGIKNITYRHLNLNYLNGTRSATPSYDYDLPILPIAGIRYEF